MIYTDFQGEKLSMLGFGTMRLPLIPGGKDSDIDQETVDKMVDLAIEKGINYFDTAYPYHGSCSELSIGASLSRYPREKYNLATKYPGHQIVSSYDPAAVFEDQLHKCRVEYFDFYLMHNVNESSISTYLDPKWGILDYFIEQKKQGRIRHLGFSAHGTVENMKKYLEKWGEHMEFCQIQLNYLDWSLQDAKGKCELLKEWNIPLWVMEPVRGGKLARLDEESESKLKSLRPNDSIPSWCFRWLQTVPQPTMILSGMSNLEQMEDNIKTFSELKPLSRIETELLYGIAEGLKNTYPCTSCRYCCASCPRGLDIPFLISLCNETRIYPSVNTPARYESLPVYKNASACIGCGRCRFMCPQRINVPAAMRELDEKMKNTKTWAQMCREREEAQNRQKQK